MGKYYAGDLSIPEYDTNYSDTVFVGSTKVSIDSLPNTQAGDKVFCIFLMGDEDPSVVVPVVMGYTHNGTFYPTSLYSFEELNSGNPSPKMSDLEGVFGNGQIGDVMQLHFITFKDIQTNEQVSKMDPSRLAKALKISQLLKPLNNDYLGRIAGNNDLLDMESRLDEKINDIGMLPKYVNIRYVHPLGE